MADKNRENEKSRACGKTIILNLRNQSDTRTGTR